MSSVSMTVYGENMTNRKTQIPEKFYVSLEVRAYCAEQWGEPYLADVFLTDFKETFEENGIRHKNWDTTFKTYIRRNSPRGPFFKRDWWERQCQAARGYKQPGKGAISAGANLRISGEQTHESPDGERGSQGENRGRKSTWIPASPTGLEAMRHIKTLLPRMGE